MGRDRPTGDGAPKITLLAVFDDCDFASGDTQDFLAVLGQKRAVGVDVMRLRLDHLASYLELDLFAQ